MAVMTLNDKTHWEPTPDQVDKWKAAYQAIDVDRELLAASAWLDSNPTKRKTKRGIARFCNSWLARAQDKGGSGFAKPKRNGVSTRDMSVTDELSHVFVDSPDIREHFLAKFGQYFENGQRYTK